MAKNYVGVGTTLPNDRAFNLSLCAKDDRIVLASQEGFLLTASTTGLPYTIEETLRLSATDHIVASFPLGQKKQVVFVTNTGKCITRDVDWLEAADTLKVKGQAVFSEERRKSGVRLVGAAAVDPGGWSAALDSRGALTLFPISALLDAGSLIAAPSSTLEILAFTTADH